MRKAKKKGVGFRFKIEFANVLTCFMIIARKQLTRRSSCQGPWSGGDAEDEEVGLGLPLLSPHLGRLDGPGQWHHDRRHDRRHQLLHRHHHLDREDFAVSSSIISAV